MISSLRTRILMIDPRLVKWVALATMLLLFEPWGSDGCDPGGGRKLW